jgi:hypothetical protein
MTPDKFLKYSARAAYSEKLRVRTLELESLDLSGRNRYRAEIFLNAQIGHEQLAMGERAW